MLLLLGLVGIGLSAFALDLVSEDENDAASSGGGDTYSDDRDGVEFDDLLALEDIEPNGSDGALDIVSGDDADHLGGTGTDVVVLDEHDMGEGDTFVVGGGPEGTEFHDYDGDLDLVLSGVDVELDVASGVVNFLSDGADHLVGGAGNDFIILGEHDTGEGGAGEDTFVIGRSPDGDVPEILDFEINLDLIKISLPCPENLLAETWPDRPEFEGEIEISNDDSFTYIWVENELVCKIAGHHEVSTDDIEVEYDFSAGLSTSFDTTYGY